MKERITTSYFHQNGSSPVNPLEGPSKLEIKSKKQSIKSGNSQIPTELFSATDSKKPMYLT
jgi:hypothetical protein